MFNPNPGPPVDSPPACRSFPRASFSTATPSNMSFSSTLSSLRREFCSRDCLPHPPSSSSAEPLPDSDSRASARDAWCEWPIATSITVPVVSFGVGPELTTIFISIIALSRPLRKRAAYIGLISASEFSAIAIAPILGGALTSSLSWRWCFYINLPAAAAPTAVLLCLKLPSTPSSHAKRQIEKLRQLDLLGFFLLAPAVLCLLLALQWGGTAYRWDSVRIIVLFVLAAAIFSVFCVNQHRKQNAAMLPPRLLKKRAILSGALFSLSLAATQAIVQFYVSGLACRIVVLYVL